MKKRLRGALVGYGFIGSHGHLPAYLQRMEKRGDVDIVAIADICEARRTLAAKALPHGRIYSDHVSLLAAELPHLDFLDIAAPPYEHAAIAQAALTSGLHVLCEKPLATSVTEAETLLRTAVKCERVLFPCHNYKHAPVVKAIRDVVIKGSVGPIRSVTLNTYRNTHAKGVPEWKTHWRRFKKWSGGGITMDHGPHSFYLAFEWLGSYPTAVTAKMANLNPSGFDTEDNVNCVLTFPTGLAHVHLSWTAGVRKVIYSLQGERGAITVEDDRLQVATMEATSGPDVAQGAVRWNVEDLSIQSHWMDASHVQWFDSLFEEFKMAIKKNQYIGRDAYEAYLAMNVIHGAYESAQNGCKEISLDSIRNTVGERVSAQWHS